MMQLLPFMDECAASENNRGLSLEMTISLAGLVFLFRADQHGWIGQHERLEVRAVPTDAFFRPDLFKFLQELKRHNNRDWFAKKKQRYEDAVRDPALLFIENFGPHLHKLSPHFVADARPTRGSLFRIYRDTRFSPDKRPFKTHVGIRFSHASGKDAHAPVFYLHLEPDNCFAAAGVWHPDSSALTKIRTAIVAEPERWAKARRKLELEGDSLTRPPRGFDPNHRFIEDIKRKDFVASVGLTEEQVCGPKFILDFAAACGTMLLLVVFTTKALGLVA
jgi:uncharacterized protein (TIGR02453 family)